MSYLANIRQGKQTWGRRALGLFGAVWLNLAVQPCAMAYEADDHDCPHCPPAHTHEHGDMHGSMDDKMPCADGAADCTIDEDWSHDARGAQHKLKDLPSELPVAIAPQELNAQLYRPVGPAGLSGYSPVRAGAPPSLNVLYCVYLK